MLGRSGAALVSMVAATPFDPECIQFLWICGSRLQPPRPTFLISYWQIKALLMLAPSVVTPQNQYFPDNAERMSVHYLESGCIGKYTPSALEIALGLRPRAMSRASGCKIPALGKSLGPRGVYFPIHPSSRQCTDTISISNNNNIKSQRMLWTNSLRKLSLTSTFELRGNVSRRTSNCCISFECDSSTYSLNRIYFHIHHISWGKTITHRHSTTVSLFSLDQVPQYIGSKLLFLQLSRKYIDDLHEHIIPSISPGNQGYRCKLLQHYCHANPTHHLPQNGRRLPHWEGSHIERDIERGAPIYISRNNFRAAAGLRCSPINRRDKEKFGGSISDPSLLRFADTTIKLPEMKCIFIAEFVKLLKIW